MGVTLALLSMLSFGSNILLVRYAMARMNVEQGFFVVLVVNILFCGAVFCVEYMFREAPFVWRTKEACLFALGGFVGTYLARRMMFETVRVLGPARSSVVHSSVPAFTLVAAWVFAGERLGSYELALMGIVMFGLWFAQPVPAGVSAGSQPARDLLTKAFLVGGLTVAGFALGNVFRGLAMRGWNEAVFGTLIASVTALVCQLATTRDLAKIWRGIRSADPHGVALFCLCGVATVCGGIFLVSAMHYMEIALATLVAHSTPLVIFPVSVLVYRNREGLSTRTALGATLVLIGIVLLAFR